MCFKDQFNNILVGKSFSYPTPGNCKIFNGFFNNTDYAVSGNACTTSNGFYVNLQPDHERYRGRSQHEHCQALLVLHHARRDGDGLRLEL